MPATKATTYQPVSSTFERLLLKLTKQDESFSLLLKLINGLPENNFFLGGGAVRDVLSDDEMPVKDIDIFLTAEALEKIKGFLMDKGNLVVNQFGTNRWFPKGTDRKFYYDIIQIPKFYNGLWDCRDITDVLNQFDITANAVAFDLLSGQFFNPQNGLNDIQNKILRAVRFDFPELAVSKDIDISRNTVLWFRYNYYAQKLGYEIEPLTKGWIADNAFRSAEIEKFKQYFFDPKLSL
jgi:hypothetical protein